MGSTLLSLVQSACAELALAVPGAVAGATDVQTTQMFALANAVGADLLTKTQWTALQTLAVINVEQPLTGTCDTIDGVASVTAYGVDVSLMTRAQDWILSGNSIPTSSRATLTAGSMAAAVINMDSQATATQFGEAISVARDTYEVPADFVTFVNDTQWDRGNHWRLQGPASPQEDEWLRSGIVTTGPRRWFRQVGRGTDVFRLWPPPAANDVPGPLTYEYLSNYWASDSAGTPKARFTADTDTCIYDDRTIVEGIKWRFFAAKGFDYGSSYALWQRQVDIAISRDGGSPTLNMTRRKWPIFISPANVADGNWPGMS